MSSRYISLRELLETYEICIPIIQRDYVQGADNEETNGIRKRLIGDIIETLKDDIKILNLNIIYGIIEDSEVFYPIDGQQRLTTLYLFHWFLAIKAEKVDEFSTKYKKLTYITRTSAKEFFTLLSKSTSEIRKDINKLIDLKSKERFREEIKSKIWFKYQWHNDMTITSALNIIGEFLELGLSKYDAKNYYDRLWRIKMHFLKEDRLDAELEASIRYIRMNSRGKQLTNFENIKAILEIVEGKLDYEIYNGHDDELEKKIRKKEEQFGYKYDNKYIDVFYKRVNRNLSLDEKVDNMNIESINILMNVYNIVCFIRNGIENKQYDDYFKFYSELYEASQKKELSRNEKIFWKEYFDILKGILEFYYNTEEIKEYINAIFEEMLILNNNENKKLIAYILYIYYKSINLKGNDEDNNRFDIEKIHKLNYVLDNLEYNKWKQNAYREVNSFAKEISIYKDVFTYFSEKYKIIINTFNVDCKDGQILNLKIDFKDLGVNDIKQRFKEQSIKAQIIKVQEMKTDCSYKKFEEIEKVSGCRKIQYLLYVSDMWENKISDEKIEQLDKYISISKQYFMQCSDNKNSICSENELEWRKICAITTNWDEFNNTLFESEIINENINKKSSYNLNIWYWDDKYYFWDDKEDIEKKKLEIVKKAYNLLLMWDPLKLVKSKLEKKDYNNCWLKYAINRNYKELLVNNINHFKNQLTIQYENTEKNYFSVVLYLDFKKNELLTSDNEMYIHHQRLRNNVSFRDMLFKADRNFQTLTFLKNQLYKYHDHEGYQHKEDKNYNISLYGFLDIKIELMKKHESSFFYCDVKRKYLSEYVFKLGIGEYTQHIYSFESVVEEIKAFNKKVKDGIKCVREDEIDCVEEKENVIYWDELLQIKRRNSDKWVYYGSNTRDWYYIESDTKSEKLEEIGTKSGKLDSILNKYEVF